MKGSKIQIICSLLLFSVFFISNNVFAQQEKDMKKKIVIIKKTMDKDGNVNVEKTVKEGEDAKDFDVSNFLKENKEEDGQEVDVEVMVTDGTDGKEERTVDVTVEGDNVIINEGGEKTVIKMEGNGERREITTEDGNHIIIMTKDGEDVGELLEEMEVTIDEDGEKEIRIMKSGKRSGAFFGVMVNPEEDGVQLLDVVKDSPAEKSGFKKGDVLVNINGEKIFTYKELTTELSKYKAGERIVVVYTRDGNLNKAAVQLTEAADVPMEETMIWKTEDGEEIEIEGGKEIHFDEEHEDGKKKVKKIIIIKKDN